MKKALTLIELLAVVAIVAILGAILVPIATMYLHHGRPTVVRYKKISVE